jgi:type IV pilus assembly protein PilO
MDFFKDRVITKADWLIIGVSLFLLVMLSLGYFFWVGYLNDQVEQKTTEINGLEEEKARREKMQAELNDIEKEIEEIRNKVASFEDKLPTGKEIPRLLDQFQEIAELSGVKYQLVKADNTMEKDLYVRIPFTVKVLGAYPQIGEFLRSLEFGDRFITVEEIKIGSEEKGESEANFIISTFMFIEKLETEKAG